MTDQQAVAAGQQQAVANAGPKAHACKNNIDPPASHPHLKVFGPDIGAFEYELSTPQTTIGRADESDIKLHHKTVSRKHATITREDGLYVLRDLAWNHCTTVNGKRVDSHALRHDDTIQISEYVLQFQSQAHTMQTMASRASAKAEQLLHARFRLLPSSMQVRYRAFVFGQEKIFQPGDTLQVGRGGLLIPVSDPPGDSCLELNLKWPNGREQRFIGGIMGVITDAGVHWMCLKLHRLPKKQLELIVAAAEPGPWIDVVPT